VAHFLAVRALNTRIVSRKRALSALVTLGIAVSADNLSRVGAVLLAMSLLTAVMASTATAALRAVARKVTNYPG